LKRFLMPARSKVAPRRGQRVHSACLILAFESIVAVSAVWPEGASLWSAESHMISAICTNITAEDVNPEISHILLHTRQPGQQPSHVDSMGLKHLEQVSSLRP